SVPPKNNPLNSVLIGNPAFNMDSLQLVKNKNINYSKSQSALVSSPDITGPGWVSLPGTEEEVKKVKKLFDQNKIASQLYVDQQANEENLKKLAGHSPELLFIATHGFFLAAKKAAVKANSYGRSVLVNADDPLLRSGLVLAGANYVWNGKHPIEGIEDGL